MPLDNTGQSPNEQMQQMTVYVKETDHVGRKPLYLEILNYVKASSGAGATVLRGIAGYSSSSRSITTAGLADVQQKLPLVIVIVDAAWRIEMMLPQIEEWVHVNGGLVTVQDLEAHRYLHPNLPREAQRTRPLQVGDIMTRHVTTVQPGDSAANVVSMLLGKYYKALPVVDADNRVLGIITDGDLMEKGKLPFRLSILEALEASGERGLQEILEELRSSKMTAKDLMSTGNIVTVTPSTPALDAARAMVEQRIKRIPVVDQAGRLVGIVGRLDILKSAEAIFPEASTQGEKEGEGKRPTIHLGDILDPGVPIVASGTPMHDIVEMLVQPPCPRRIVVVDSLQHRHVVGMIADRDVVMRAHAQSRPGLLQMLREGLPFHRLTPTQQAESKANRRTAADIMSLNVVAAPAAMPLYEAVRLIVQREVKLLPVVDQTGALLGAVGRMRVLEAMWEKRNEPGYM